MKKFYLFAVMLALSLNSYAYERLPNINVKIVDSGVIEPLTDHERLKRLSIQQMSDYEQLMLEVDNDDLANIESAALKSSLDYTQKNMPPMPKGSYQVKSKQGERKFNTPSKDREVTNSYRIVKPEAWIQKDVKAKKTGVYARSQIRFANGNEKLFLNKNNKLGPIIKVKNAKIPDVKKLKKD